MIVSQVVQIQDRQVLLGSGFPALAPVPVLFDETFYNDQEQSYSVVCISRPLEVEPGLSEPHPLPPSTLKSLEDVRDFLGPHTQKLDKLIQSFCQAYRQQERKGLRHHIVGLHVFLWFPFAAPLHPDHLSPFCPLRTRPTLSTPSVFSVC